MLKMGKLAENFEGLCTLLCSSMDLFFQVQINYNLCLKSHNLIDLNNDAHAFIFGFEI